LKKKNICAEAGRTSATSQHDLQKTRVGSGSKNQGMLLARCGESIGAKNGELLQYPCR
jgi:hypothetical protein